MYVNAIYKDGVSGVLKVQWTLLCQTPLVVRNGVSIGYQEDGETKSRGLNVRFVWAQPKEEDPEHQVSGLHFDYEVNAGQVNVYHSVPSSSVRGALRSWTMRHLVDPEMLKKLVIPDADDERGTEDYLAHVRRVLEHKKFGYQLIASLFGLALDTRTGDDVSGNAGRLRLYAERFTSNHSERIRVNGTGGKGETGPSNVYRQMTVRNPLDRFTHASKDGGLHHALEFCRGERFSVELLIRNPQNSDLGLLSLWTREIEAGLLRFGALSNVGRGRVSVDDARYILWKRRNATVDLTMDAFQPMDAPESWDVLAGFWEPFKLSPARLPDFEDHLIKELT